MMKCKTLGLSLALLLAGAWTVRADENSRPSPILYPTQVVIGAAPSASEGEPVPAPTLPQPSKMPRAVLVEECCEDCPCETQVKFFMPFRLFSGVGGLLGHLCAECLVGRETWVSGMTLPSGRYLDHPPQYFPAPVCDLPAPVLQAGCCTGPQGTCCPGVAAPCCPMMRPGMAPPGVCCPLPPQSPYCPPPPPVVHFVTPPMPAPSPATTVIMLGKTSKGSCVQVDSGNGVTMQCKKMTLLGPGGKPLTVYTAGDKLCVKGDGFKGAVHRIISSGDSVSVELTPRTPVVATPVVPTLVPCAAPGR